MEENQEIEEGIDVTTELDCLNVPEIHIVIEGNVKNMNITVNHFNETKEGKE